MEELVFEAILALDLNGTQILQVFTPNGSVPGTGLSKVLAQIDSLDLPIAVPSSMMDQVLEAVPGTFGDFASSSDIIPSAIFIAFFASLALGHGYVFSCNLWVGQKFYASLGMMLYATLKAIGFGLRLKSSQNSTSVADGLISQVFICLPVLLFDSITCIFGRRVFTWRHPETGASRTVSYLFNSFYLITFFIIPLAIIGQSLPFIYFETPSHLQTCLNITRVAGIMQFLYCLIPFYSMGLAYVFPVGSLTDELFRFPLVDAYRKPPSVLQPFWIRKRSLFYFPHKNSQFRLFKDDVNSQTIRLICSSVEPANGKSISVIQEECNGPRTLWIIFHLVFVSCLLTIGQIFRVASTFIYKPRMGYSQPYSSFLYKSWPMYMSTGGLELAASLYFLVFRLDLIYYIPDSPLKGKSAENIDFDGHPPLPLRSPPPCPKFNYSVNESSVELPLFDA